MKNAIYNEIYDSLCRIGVIAYSNAEKFPNMLNLRYTKIFTIFSLLFFYFASIASGITVIRDDEIESFLYDIATPIFKVAELESDKIRIHIVQDSTLNAFVMDRQNMFINTGLLMQVRDVEGLLGIIAHETGHIAECHSIKMYDNIIRARNTQLLTMAAALLAGVATNDPSVTAGTIMGSHYSQVGVIMSYSRAQEYAADSASAKYLNKLGIGIGRMISVLKHFYSSERMLDKSNDIYYRTHPLSKDRIDMLEHAHKKIGVWKERKKIQERYNLILAKLDGMVLSKDAVDIAYKDEESEVGKYVRAIFAFRTGDVKKAIGYIDQLIQINSRSPYYPELKGDVLYSKGDIKSAIPLYEKATNLKNKKWRFVNNATLQLAIVLMADGVAIDTDKAIKLIIQIIKEDDADLEAWKQLGVAYIQSGKEYLGNLALAEHAILSGEKDLAKKFIAYAEVKKATADDEKIQKTLQITPEQLKDLIEQM